MQMLSQVELEKQIVARNRAKVAAMLQKNEDSGRAEANPYASKLYSKYVQALAALLEADRTSTVAQRRIAASKELDVLEAETVAVLAVSHSMCELLTNKDAVKDVRVLGRAVGRVMHGEVLLTLFEHINPELYFTITNDLERRLSSNERHRLVVMRMQAEKAGIILPEWGPAVRESVGLYLVDRMQTAGFLITASHKASRGLGMVTVASFSEEAADMIASISHSAISSIIIAAPLIEPPVPWPALTGGGYHTPEMRRAAPYMVLIRGFADYSASEIEQTRSAINKLQSVPWAVNKRVLQAAKAAYSAGINGLEEIVSQFPAGKPLRPEWLVSADTDKSTWTPKQTQEFILWKRTMADWYTSKKLQGVHWGRMVTNFRIADEFADYAEIYFVYQADFRGRLYALSQGLSPQGSDLQKALLKFARGKPLDTPEARRWFCILGANKFGFDKASLAARAKWPQENQELILSIADDPVSNYQWVEADSPFQFLAWCFEYAEWMRSNDTEFRSHLPCSMDGSCNGLQNLSALLRDPVGGAATNLVPAAKPEDIYQRVADRVPAMIRATPDDEHGFKHRWLEHGINRKIVKRSVMTMPYGSNQRSASEFILHDYLERGGCPLFSKHESHGAAVYLAKPVWNAIGEVVVKAREAMQWLQKASGRILKHGPVVWFAPTGFRVQQEYFELDVKRVETRLNGVFKIKVASFNDTPDPNRHRNGMAPNFVHSLDAAHLTMVVNACQDIDLACIHDDYGTHCADAAKLYHAIREQFVSMYTRWDPLGELHAQYPFLPAPPTPGELDITRVVDSQYFFS